MKRILFLNDYACDNETIIACKSYEYPKSHMWGIADIVDSYNIKLQLIRNVCDLRFIGRLVTSFLIFIRNFRSDIIYSALPGYELFFLLAKYLKFKNYRVISVVHHPSSKLIMADCYDKIICISKICYDILKNKGLNVEYIFWGGDINFFLQHKIDVDIKYDFITAGKTYRDFDMFSTIIPQITDRYIAFGYGNTKVNEISYVELCKYYYKSRFICIPLVLQDNADILMGLTSFVDAMAMGKPILMADNSLIGVDVDTLGIGYIYKAGNYEDFRQKAIALMRLDEKEYDEMCNNCRKFAYNNSYEKFANRIKELLLYQDLK